MDISHYMRAVTEAERIDFPNRARLYDLYDTILLDTHLSSVLEKRKSAVLSSQIEFSRDGKPDKAIGEMLESPWFLDFLSVLRPYSQKACGPYPKADPSDADRYTRDGVG